MLQEKMIFRLAFILMAFTFSSGDNSNIIETLSEHVYDEQIKQTQRYTNITHLEEIEGIYRNYIHLNVYGPEENAVLRRDVGLMDNNPFISGIVSLQVLDAYRFGRAPMPPKDEIGRIVKLYADSHEMNVDHETSVMLFFQQRYNPDLDFWQTYPANIIRVFQEISNLPAPYYKQFLDVLLGPSNQPDGLANLFSAKQITDRMRIPADFDSSGTHLCFGSILFQLQDVYPEAWSDWRDRNTNLTSIFDALKKYAYRPFSKDRDQNTIDTRSYFFMREFLDKAKIDGTDLAIIPTWAMDIARERVEHQKGNSMPWGVNIIDMTVIANFMAGLFSALDNGLIEHRVVTQDEDLNLILDSSASLMVYFLQHNLTDRPDLSLAYYPATIEFYWFVARGLLYMENAKLRGTLNNIPVYDKYYRGLSDVMRSAVTRSILSTRKFDQGGSIFYDDFLGNADLSYDQKYINRAEDRYYTTAMVANSLIYTWSVYDENQDGLRWIDTVPDDVVATVYGLSKWLEKNPLGGGLGVRNAFFSVSEKNRETIPLWYPANRFEYLNGTTIDNFHGRIPEELTVFGMEGYVEPDDYRKMLDIDQFDVETQLDFLGYNSGQGAVIFWSCDAVAFAGAMMSMSMTNGLQESENK